MSKITFFGFSIPFMVKYINEDGKSLQLDSEYEPIELALEFKDKVEWVWIGVSINYHLIELYLELKNTSKFVVSPIHGHKLSMIKDFKNKLMALILMLCTKDLTYGFISFLK